MRSLIYSPFFGSQVFFAKAQINNDTRDKVVFVDEFLGFNIYLHDRGQFWPGLEMGEFFKTINEQTTLRIEITEQSSLQAELG